MVRQLAARFREEIDAADVGGAVLLLGILAVVGFDTGAVGILAGIFVGVPIVRAAVDATGFDIEPGLAGFLLGLIVVVAGVVQLLDGSHLFGWGLVAVGCWICLDGVDRWRRDDYDRDSPEDDVSKSEVLLLGEHNRWLVEELREADRPLTADEIQSRTGLTEDDFERLLEHHGDSSPIERVGNGYTIDENEMGIVALIRALVRTTAGRLCRPFRLFRPSG